MSNQGTDIWNKFKSSTKSLSTSFSNLSVKTEKDGDTPESTLIHKALVKHYRKKEPFEGFPEWLGHTEEIPDRQTPINSARISSPGQSSRSGESSVRSTAGMAFQKIYSSVQSAKTSGEYTSSRNFYQQESHLSDQYGDSGSAGSTFRLQREYAPGSGRLNSDGSASTGSQRGAVRSHSHRMLAHMRSNISRRETFDL
ncbi:HDL160Wp [Eremothecium sinecaudum]|uniref:HDL160Wp n=1 Tax=Eremothecium sinecaudum TaxID=45286 RepID=A0A0X8HSE3_9SACH|nr:HDL160Wp [Eremothecium sinecaudum]AMD20584.1 HDL160Wp [Eremothecium sinecaudum]